MQKKFLRTYTFLGLLFYSVTPAVEAGVYEEALLDQGECGGLLSGYGCHSRVRALATLRVEDTEEGRVISPGGWKDEGGYEPPYIEYVGTGVFLNVGDYWVGSVCRGCGYPCLRAEQPFEQFLNVRGVESAGLTNERAPRVVRTADSITLYLSEKDVNERSGDSAVCLPSIKYWNFRNVYEQAIVAQLGDIPQRRPDLVSKLWRTAVMMDAELQFSDSWSYNVGENLSPPSSSLFRSISCVTVEQLVYEERKQAADAAFEYGRKLREAKGVSKKNSTCALL